VLRARWYQLVEGGFSGSRAAWWIAAAIVTLIILNALAVVVGSDPVHFQRYFGAFHVFELFSIAVFTVEYLLRVWVAPENPRYAGQSDWTARMRYIVSPVALVDLVAILSRDQKAVPSEQGHLLARTSPLLEGRLASLGGIVTKVKKAIRERNLQSLGQWLEADALCMHAVMMTSRPALLYWEPATLAVVKAVRGLRVRRGLPCYFTIDAGPNVHVITLPEQANAVTRALKKVEGVQEVLRCPTGRGAYLQEESLF